jgi:hypothetical protein
MKTKTIYTMERSIGYGQYNIVKTTPKGKFTKVHFTDSSTWDDYQDNKVSQARLKRIFNLKN